MPFDTMMPHSMNTSGNEYDYLNDYSFSSLKSDDDSSTDESDFDREINCTKASFWAYTHHLNKVNALVGNAADGYNLSGNYNISRKEYREEMVRGSIELKANVCQDAVALALFMQINRQITREGMEHHWDKADDLQMTQLSQELADYQKRQDVKRAFSVMSKDVISRAPKNKKSHQPQKTTCEPRRAEKVTKNTFDNELLGLSQKLSRKSPQKAATHQDRQDRKQDSGESNSEVPTEENTLEERGFLECQDIHSELQSKISQPISQDTDDYILQSYDKKNQDDSRNIPTENQDIHLEPETLLQSGSKIGFSNQFKDNKRDSDDEYSTGFESESDGECHSDVDVDEKEDSLVVSENEKMIMSTSDNETSSSYEIDSDSDDGSSNSYWSDSDDDCSSCYSSDSNSCNDITKPTPTSQVIRTTASEDTTDNRVIQPKIKATAFGGNGKIDFQSKPTAVSTERRRIQDDKRRQFEVAFPAVPLAPLVRQSTLEKRMELDKRWMLLMKESNDIERLGLENNGKPNAKSEYIRAISIKDITAKNNRGVSVQGGKHRVFKSKINAATTAKILKNQQPHEFENSNNALLQYQQRFLQLHMDFPTHPRSSLVRRMSSSEKMQEMEERWKKIASSSSITCKKKERQALMRQLELKWKNTTMLSCERQARRPLLTSKKMQRMESKWFSSVKEAG